MATLNLNAFCVWGCEVVNTSPRRPTGNVTVRTDA